MKFRFRKRIKIAPGVRLNISKSGISTSVGRRGATVNLGKQGTRVTVGIPGSGVSTSKLYKSKAKNKESTTPNQAAVPAHTTKPRNKSKILVWILAIFLLTAALNSYFTADKTSSPQPTTDKATYQTTGPEHTPTEPEHAADGKAPSPTIKTLYVAPPTLNVRAAPNSKIIGTINQGVPVKIYQERDGWFRISPENDTEKWVASQYLCTEQSCNDAK